jgi:hypothetical protein
MLTNSPLVISKPKGAAEDEGLGILAHEVLELRVAVPAPEGPEVDVLNAADVVALVDADAGAEGLAVEPADVVAAGVVRSEVDGAVGIDEEAVDDGGVVGARAADAPGIGSDGVHVLAGVEDGEALDRSVEPEGDKGRAILGALALLGEERGALVLGPGRRDGEDALERDVVGDEQVGGDAVVAAGHQDDAAAGFGGGVEGLLDGGGVIGLGIADGAEVADIEGGRGGVSGVSGRRRFIGEGGAG